MAQQLIFTNNVPQALDKITAEMSPSNCVVITDRNVREAVVTRLQRESKTASGARVITVEPGEANKSTDTLAMIWTELMNAGVTRKSLIINIGGGVITDMGAFAASTFKRGVRFINIPTTLLAAVDASVGGKTGVNFGGVKNLIGMFSEAEAVILSTVYMKTLPESEILSGYAEMIKHGLISSRNEYYKLLSHNITEVSHDRMLELLRESVAVKCDIVRQDPTEKGIRKALNLGHTIGHAFEELAMERNAPIPHGYAVIHGLTAELILSKKKTGFPSDEITRLREYVDRHYGRFTFSAADYDHLIALMRHDKKNETPDAISFTLLSDIGKVEINHSATENEIKETLDEYRHTTTI